MAELAPVGAGAVGAEYSDRPVAPLYDDQGLVVSPAAREGGPVRASCR